MFAKIKYRLNAFLADWKEYKKLRSFAAKAWHKLEGLRAKITVSQDAERGCIRAEIKQTLAIDESFATTVETTVVEKYCHNFKPDMDGANVQPCSHTDCPYYAAHSEYRDAAAAYGQAVQKRREFWNNSNTAQK